jgi:enoyl-CoA hydratase/carnithine racemase
MTEPAVLYELKSKTVLLTLNRPDKRNALNEEVIGLLLEHLRTIDQDERVRAVCLTGTGGKVFCAGGDLATMGKHDRLDQIGRLFVSLLNQMDTMSKPLVAKINGDCLAGGVGLILACDLAYAHSKVGFATPEVKVGLFPMIIGPMIIDSLGRKRALEMMFTGRRYTAAQAAAHGLISRVFEPTDLDGQVDLVLAELAANSPQALSRGRRALFKSGRLGKEEAREFLAGRLAELIRTADAAEGLKAFLEKRAPAWR